MVLGAHLVDGWRLPAGALRGVPAPLVFVFSRGWLGVDLFFVLSGLLITGILLDSRARPSYFRDFYASRFLRIIPLYFTVITITFLAYRSPVLYFLLSYCFLANIAGVLRVGCRTALECSGHWPSKSTFTLPGQWSFASCREIL
jgi:peptidoglycan/LPS O-acetylase OafA/YrhL